MLERQNQVEITVGALDMENEAFQKAQLFSWIFFPIWILLAIMQAVCFLLSNGKLHPLAKILEACNDGNNKKIVTRYLQLLSRFSNLFDFHLDIVEEITIDTCSCVFNEENEEEEDSQKKGIELENGESEV